MDGWPDGYTQTPMRETGGESRRTPSPAAHLTHATSTGTEPGLFEASGERQGRMGFLCRGRGEAQRAARHCVFALEYQKLRDSFLLGICLTRREGMEGGKRRSRSRSSS